MDSDEQTETTEKEQTDGQEGVAESQANEETGGEPQSLEEAMRLVRETDSSVSPADMASPESTEGSGEQAESDNRQLGGEGSVSSSAATDADISGSDRSEPDRTPAEPARVPERVRQDYSAATTQLLEGITRQASADATRELEENSVQKFGINQLYQKDERTGRVTFINPDDPDRPFQSRSEAQSWIDSFNSQVDAAWQKRAQEKQQEYLESMTPSINLLNFAPTYEQLPRRVQQTMDTLIEPYSVYDASGKVIGFNCDLDAAARQAIAIDQRYASNTRKSAKGGSAASQTKTPAVDMKTSSSAHTTVDEAPKNLNDAMKRYNEQQRSAKKGKK